MPDQVQVVAFVNVGLTPAGQIVVQAEGPNQVLLLGMLEKAKDQLLAQWKQAEAGPKIVAAPPGLVARLNGRG